MKKTFITMLILAAGAMGETLTFSTTDDYSGNQGGSYAGVAFTLNAIDTQRFTAPEGELTAQVGLTSITLTERGGHDLDATHMLYITDASNVYLGSSSVMSKAEGSDVCVFTFDTSITLNTADTYYAYLWKSSDSAIESWVAGTTTVDTGKYYSGHLAVVGGSYTSDNAANWGLLSGQKALTANGYAPAMEICVKLVPEPATATLSLLALAGLAARRRRK